MKKLVLFGVVSLFCMGSALFISSCEKDALEPLGLTDTEDSTAIETRGSSTIGSNNPLIVSPYAVTFGKSFPQWTVEYWKYVLRFGCEYNPILDENGQDALVGQNGQVVFLAGAERGSFQREISFTRDKLVLFPVVSVIKTFPCVDALTGPAPGQTVDAFLIENARRTLNQAKNLIVSLDGAPIVVTSASRYTTRPFIVTGNKELNECTDLCITGMPQSAVSDGYWIMLRPLAPGKHVLHVHGELAGNVTDITYYLIVK